MDAKDIELYYTGTTKRYHRYQTAEGEKPIGSFYFGLEDFGDVEPPNSIEITVKKQS